MSAEKSTVTKSPYEVQSLTAHGTSHETTSSEDDWSTITSKTRSTSRLNNLDMVSSTKTSNRRRRTSRRSSHSMKTTKSYVARRTTARRKNDTMTMTAKPDTRSGIDLKRTSAHGHETIASRESTTKSDSRHAFSLPKMGSYPSTSASSTNARIPPPATHGSSRKTTNGSHAHTTKSSADKKYDKAISALIADLRKKAAVAFDNSKSRWFSPSDAFRQNLMWLGLLAPLAILCAYITFVVVSRNTASQPGGSDRSFRAPVVPPKSRKLSIAELRKKNWIRRRRPVAQCYDEFDKKDFHQAGPLVLTKELKGDVKFSDVPSNEIVQVQYDKDLNEVVNIGTKVEVIPPTEPATALSIEEKEKKEMPKTHRVPTGDEKATTMRAVQATETDTDKETQQGGESTKEVRTGMGSVTTKLEDNTEIEPKELTAIMPAPTSKPEKLPSRLAAKKSGLFKAAKQRKSPHRKTEKVDPTETDHETGFGR
ncbi:hypothetical protein GCK32_006414 [Trichostrongylus colubriformis]|uniref:Uncharacterized protein n=1 Tax=Trichostrongylus colubriformis TaxID=6319 RepID=A0AAN8EXT1_TRICO